MRESRTSGSVGALGEQSPGATRARVLSRGNVTVRANLTAGASSACGSVERLAQIRRIGKQGRRVAIVAHAENHHIEGARHAVERAPRHAGAEIRCGTPVLEPREPGRGGGIFQQDLSDQPFVAGGIRGIDPPLIRQRNAHAYAAAMSL